MQKIALVTGVSSGLGKQTRLQMQARGWRVLGTYAEMAPDSPDEDQFQYHATETGVRTLVAWVLRKTQNNGLDALINNAGVNHIARFGDFQLGHLRSLMEINFVIPVYLTHLLLPDLGLKKGVVCNVVSDASWKPMRHSLAYNCSKAALAMATKQLARETTKITGVTIFSVNPGKMHSTEMSRMIDDQVQEIRNWTKEEADKYFQNASVTGKEADPDRIAWHIANLVEGHHELSGATIDLVG